MGDVLCDCIALSAFLSLHLCVWCVGLRDCIEISVSVFLLMHSIFFGFLQNKILVKHNSLLIHLEVSQCFEHRALSHHNVGLEYQFSFGLCIKFLFLVGCLFIFVYSNILAVCAYFSVLPMVSCSIFFVHRAWVYLY